jgi:hypothetical protein
MQVVRVLLVGLVVASIGWVLWQHPRTGTMAGFRQALASGRATSVEIVTSQDAEISVGKPWRTPDRTPNVPYVRWVTSDHRVHDAPVGPGGFPNGYDSSTMADNGIPHSELLSRAARRDLSAWMQHQDGGGFATHKVNLLPLLALVCTLLLVVGPPTRRGTKWAWFWFTGAAPLGLGMLLWLAVEAPWSRRLAQAPPGHPPGPGWLRHRRDGWAGLGWGLVVWIGAQVLFRAAAAIL